jgi:hypothetical protein
MTGMTPVRIELIDIRRGRESRHSGERADSRDHSSAKAIELATRDP